MRLAEKLLEFIHSAFDKSPGAFVAFRARHASDAFRWRIADDVLTGYLDDDILFAADLTEHTLASLTEFLSAQAQITVIYGASKEAMGASATTLLDGEGAQASSNGDVFLAYSSILWAWLHSVALELKAAKEAIGAMVDQMSIPSADDEWLDEWGGYFGVARNTGESDTAYSNRIVVEVMRPRGNNKAIEQALLDRFGQAAAVNDVTRWRNATQTHNSAFSYNSAILHNAVADPLYGLFEVEIGYDLESGADLLAFAGQVRAFIEQFRDAGTHLDSLRLSDSKLEDAFASPPTDDGAVQVLLLALQADDTLTAPVEAVATIPITLAGMGDTLTGPADSATIDVTYTTKYDGLRSFNGIVKHQSGLTVAELT